MLRVNFWHSDKTRERLLADAFLEGVRKRGDTGQALCLPAPEELPPCDVACMVGVKSKDLFQAYWDAGIHTVYLDKGYIRAASGGPLKTWNYWRIAVDGHHPTRYLEDIRCKPDRFTDLGLEVRPWRSDGRHILFAGSSEKYHNFYGLEHPTNYAKAVVRKLNKLTNRNVVYRPKPSWKGATEIDGSIYGGEGSISDWLRDAWCLVTHGSNAVFEAILAGVPTVVLGDAVTRPISSTDIGDCINPFLATDRKRMKLLHALAHCQWTLPEMREGLAWDHIKSVMQ